MQKMIGETTYKITVSRADSDVIKNLVDILENCPMGFRISYVQVLDYWAYYCHIAGIHMGVELSEFGSSEKEKNNIWK